MCHCSPTVKDGYAYYPIIANMFRQCVYTPVEIISFWLGMMNIGFWLIAQFPQVIETYIRGEVEALSPLFILQWLLGDICNVIGCIFTKQYPTQLYTAYYYVCMDCIMLSQYAYYVYIKPIWNARKDFDKKVEEAHKQARIEMAKIRDLQTDTNFYSLTTIVIILATLAHFAYQNGVLGASGSGGYVSDICDATPPLSQFEHFIGVASAWISGILYFTARIPQIFLNHKRRSVQGLSFTMFFCAVLGNTCYGLSVLLPGIPDWKRFIIEVFPYILGSLCTLITSFFILAQFFIYDYIPIIKERYKVVKELLKTIF